MLWLLFSVVSYADSLSLKEAIEKALVQNKEIKAQNFQIKQSEQDVRRVDGEFGPHLEATAGVGPITRATGNATSSVEDKGSLGRMLLGKVSLTQPLFTWGRKDNYYNAALAGVHVKQAESRQKEEDVRFQVKEAYYGYQLANSLLDLIENGKSDLQKALDKKKKAKKDSKEDFKLEIFLSQIEEKEAEVKKFWKLAKEGLALRVGESSEKVDVKNPWLVPEIREKKTLDFYWSKSQGERPEFRQLSEGIFAKRSLSKAEKKAMFPALVFFASYELADTNVRPPQPGVFSYDPYNRETWVLGVGFRLDLQWELQASKAAKYQAEAQELEVKQAFALAGISTELKKAYWELEEAEIRLGAAKTAQATGKRWLTKELLGFASGLNGVQGIVEAYGARAETAKSYLEAVHRYQMAWATLSKVVGQEVDPSL